MQHADWSLVKVEAGECPVEIDDIRRHLRIEDANNDDEVQALMTAVLSQLDGAGGILGRALLEQQWIFQREHFDFHGLHHGRAWRWHRHEIILPLPPLQEVTAFKYLDPLGTEQTIDPSAYRVIDGGDQCSAIVPAVGTVWPATLCAPDAFRVHFTAGWDSPDDVPGAIQHAIRLLVGHFFINREAVTDGRASMPFEMPMAVEALLAPWRVPHF